MTSTASTPVVSGQHALDPNLTPRPAFHVTRRLVGVSRYPLGLLTAIYAINQSHQFLLPTLFPFVKQEFDLSDTALGLLGGSYLLMLTVGLVPFGILADRVSRTRIIGWGTAAWGGAMLYTGLAGSYLHLFTARTLLGIADPADNPTSQSLLADYYPLRQRAKVMGVYEGGRLLGILVLPVAGAMAEAWGWRSAFYFLAVPGFVVAMMAWRLPEPERGEQDRRHQNLERGAGESVYDRAGSLHAYRDILRIPTFVVQLISSGAANLFLGGIGVWVVTFLIRYHDMSVAEASTAIALFAIGALVGSLGSGYVADYLTYRGVRGARVHVAAVSRILAFALFMPTFATGNTTLMLLLFVVAAAFLVAPSPALNAVRADVLHPVLRGRGNSLDAVTQSIAGALSPILFGILSDAIGLRGAFFVLTPVVGLAGLFLLVLGPALYPRDEERMLRQVAEESRKPGAAQPSTRVAPGQDADEPVGDRADALLATEDLEFSYGPLQVLFGVDLRVGPGQCVMLLGPNGAGKTTLLKVLAGLLEPQAGRVWFKGEDIVGVPPDQRVRLGITLMAGGRSTFPSLTVLDNLWMGGYPYAESRQLLQARLDAALDVFPALRDRLGQAAGTLSGGEQQMLALGRALVAGAELLLVDELSMGLAPVVTQDLVRVVRDIRTLGTTLLIVEQSVNVVLDVADDVYLMERGRVHHLGAAADLREGGDARLTRLMLDRRGPQDGKRPR